MSCPGLHCPGCSGGQSLVVLAATAAAVAVAAETVIWVAENLWWIVPAAVACYVLAVAAAMAMERRSDRRAAEWGAARGIRSRADVIMPPPPARRELPPVVNIYVADETMAARVIRQALPARTDLNVTGDQPAAIMRLHADGERR